MNSNPKIRLPNARHLAPLAAAVAICLSGAASAATIMVDSAVALSSRGKCTLVDAVNSINQGSIVGGSYCSNSGAPFGSADNIGFKKSFSISFSSPAPGSSSALVVRKPLTINGGIGANGQPSVLIARNGFATSTFRLIESNANLTLNNVTIAGGRVNGDGGGVKINGTASLRTSGAVITSNSASGRGGGVFVESNSATLTASTISGNSAALAGGGVYTYAGLVSLTNSTVINNRGGELGGGLAVGALVADRATICDNSAKVGGGAYTLMPSSLTNTTISENTAEESGGGLYASGTVSLLFSTISSNSVGENGTGAGLVMFFDGNTSTASIISGNTAGHDIDGPYDATLGGDHNLVGTFGVSMKVPFDSLHCDPHLAPLMHDGGPTMTQPLMDGSCAVDAGPATSKVLIDQRGVPRKIGLNTDIGAVEKQGLSDPPVQ